MIYDLGERRPVVHASSFIAPGASVIGSVELERDTSVWFNAVIRGDTDRILVREASNVQDGAVLHTDDGIVLELGPRVTVGHRAMIHGATVGEGSLIGIGATILNRAVIGRHCIIGAHALILENARIPDRSLVVGAPGRVVKRVDDAMVATLEDAARHYVDNARRFLAELAAR